MRLLNTADLRKDPVLLTLIDDTATRAGCSRNKLIAVFNALWLWFPQDTDQEHLMRFTRGLEPHRLCVFIRALELELSCGEQQ